MGTGTLRMRATERERERRVGGCSNSGTNLALLQMVVRSIAPLR